METAVRVQRGLASRQTVAVGRSILIAEDEGDLLDLLRYNFEREGYLCRCVRDGDAAISEIRREPPDLIVLDRMLPVASGDDVATEVRRDPRTARVPIIMLTAKVEESDQLVGFALGADDYVTKPFSMKVLLARSAALLKRAKERAEPSETMSAGPITMDISRHAVTVAGSRVQLTATEFRILRTLMKAEGRVLSRSQLLDLIQGTGVAVTERTIDVHITALRKKLGSANGWIQTVRGVGYTFRNPE